MKWDMSRPALVRGLAVIATGAALLAGGGSALALTPSHFRPVREQLTNEIALLQQQPDTAQNRKRLNTLLRAESVLADTAQDDGTAFRTLQALLRGKPFAESYGTPLSLTASNLVYSFNRNYAFTQSLLSQMPPSPDADRAQFRFNSVVALAQRLNAAENVSSVGNLLRAARRRLDAATLAITEALIVPFPTDLAPDTVVARVNGLNFRTSKALASENTFTATRSGDNVLITLNAVDGTVGGSNGVRVISFSVAAQNGTFRYEIPSAAAVTCSTGVYSENVLTQSATTGVVFVSVTDEEAYGQFEATGDGLSITGGQFRISLVNDTAER